MIDWTKPIETVPCDRNPVPVPCKVVEVQGSDTVTTVTVRLGSDWSHPDISERCRNSAWAFNVDGTVGNDFLPDLRNVQPTTTVTMELSREMHRALVDAGYADLGDYVKRWGDGE